MKRVLFLSAGNACRSIMAEAILNYYGGDRFQAFSAGSHPLGQVHPPVLKLLRDNGMDALGYHSKSWNEFIDTPLDYIIYLCDRAACELCPEFGGHPVRAHWCQPDIFQVHGVDPLAKMSFEDVFDCLEWRIRAFLRLPCESMARDEMGQRLQKIGTLQNEARATSFVHPGGNKRPVKQQ